MRIPTFQQLSKEQDRVLSVPLEQSCLITGPPGTGKTVIALYRARDLGKKSSEALLIVYSRLLSQYMLAAADELDVESMTKTFHSWFTTFYKARYKTMPPQVERWVYEWQEILEVVNRNPPAAGQLPYLIIDEGQDLPREFYPIAKHLGQHLTVFADENQAIMNQNSKLDEIAAYGRFGDNRYTLSRNYRNTREIALLASQFYSGAPTGIPELPERSGDVPVGHRHTSFDESMAFIRRFEATNGDLEIGVFTPTQRLQRRVVAAMTGRTRHPVQFYVGGRGREAPVLDFDAPGIKVVNYPSTKGLEFDVVFIPELQDVDVNQWDKARKQMYVMTSRARDQLHLMWTTTTRPAILKGIPEGLIRWQ